MLLNIMLMYKSPRYLTRADQQVSPSPKILSSSPYTRVKKNVWQYMTWYRMLPYQVAAASTVLQYRFILITLLYEPNMGQHCLSFRQFNVALLHTNHFQGAH